MKTSFEIVIHDDGSSTLHQQKLSADLHKFPEVRIALSPTNRGRSAARNLLARNVLGDFVLFIDGDNRIDSPQFVHHYFCHSKKNAVVVGGRFMDDYALPGCELRWNFAKQRELRGLKTRLADPYASFQTNCFLIDREVLSKVHFCEELKTYGYEDNLFGFDLEENAIQMIHIQNPQYHPADDPNEVFLEKTKEAMVSLYWIYKHKHNQHKRFKLIRLMKMSKMLKINKLCFYVLHLLAPGFTRNLVSSRPDLWRYDLYRLYLLLGIDRMQ